MADKKDIRGGGFFVFLKENNLIEPNLTLEDFHNKFYNNPSYVIELYNKLSNDKDLGVILKEKGITATDLEKLAFSNYKPKEWNVDNEGKTRNWLTGFTQLVKDAFITGSFGAGGLKHPLKLDEKTKNVNEKGRSEVEKRNVERIEEVALGVGDLFDPDTWNALLKTFAYNSLESGMGKPDMGLMPEEVKTDKEVLDALKQEAHKSLTKAANNRIERRRKAAMEGLIDPSNDDPWNSVIGSAPYMGTGIALSLISPQASASFFIAQGMAQVPVDLYEGTAEKDENGYVIEGTGSLEAATIGIPAGALYGYIENMGMEKFIGGRFLLKDIYGNTGKQLLKKVTSVYLTEGAEEVAQQGIEDLTLALFNSSRYNTFEEYVEDYANQFLGGVAGAFLFGGPVHYGKASQYHYIVKDKFEGLINNIEEKHKKGWISDKSYKQLKTLLKEIQSLPIEEAAVKINNAGNELIKHLNHIVALKEKGNEVKNEIISKINNYLQENDFEVTNSTEYYNDIYGEDAKEVKENIESDKYFKEKVEEYKQEGLSEEEAKEKAHLEFINNYIQWAINVSQNADRIEEIEKHYGKRITELNEKIIRAKSIGKDTTELEKELEKLTQGRRKTLKKITHLLADPEAVRAIDTLTEEIKKRKEAKAKLEKRKRIGKKTKLKIATLQSEIEDLEEQLKEAQKELENTINPYYVEHYFYVSKKANEAHINEVKERIKDEEVVDRKKTEQQAREIINEAEKEKKEKKSKKEKKRDKLPITPKSRKLKVFDSDGNEVELEFKTDKDGSIVVYKDKEEIDFFSSDETDEEIIERLGYHSTNPVIQQSTPEKEPEEEKPDRESKEKPEKKEDPSETEPDTKPVGDITPMKLDDITLTEQQTVIVSRVLDRLENDNLKGVIRGYAGTGKTTILRKIINEYLAKNKKAKVAVLAPTNSAKRIAAFRIGDNPNVDVRTVHSTIYYTKEDDNGELKFNLNNKGLMDYDLVIIDESSMVGSEVFKDLIDLCECNILFVGDPMQLPPVNDRQAAFESEELEKFPELTQVVRNANSISIVANHLREKLEILNINDESFQIVDPKEEAEIIRSVINDDFAIITYTNKERITLNKMVRKLKGFADPLEKGDRVINIASGQDHASIYNVVNENINLSELETEEYGVIYFGTVQLEEKYTGEIREEIIVLLPEYKNSQASPREVKKLSELIGIDPESEEKPIVATYGYAFTAHKAQGQEFDKVIVDVGRARRNEELQRLLYTAITRGKSKVYFVNTKVAPITNSTDANVEVEVESPDKPKKPEEIIYRWNGIDYSRKEFIKLGKKAKEKAHETGNLEDYVKYRQIQAIYENPDIKLNELEEVKSQAVMEWIGWLEENFPTMVENKSIVNVINPFSFSAGWMRLKQYKGYYAGITIDDDGNRVRVLFKESPEGLIGIMMRVADNVVEVFNNIGITEFGAYKLITDAFANIHPQEIKDAYEQFSEQMIANIPEELESLEDLFEDIKGDGLSSKINEKIMEFVGNNEVEPSLYEFLFDIIGIDDANEKIKELQKLSADETNWMEILGITEDQDPEIYDESKPDKNVRVKAKAIIPPNEEMTRDEWKSFAIKNKLLWTLRNGNAVNFKSIGVNIDFGNPFIENRETTKDGKKTTYKELADKVTVNGNTYYVYNKKIVVDTAEEAEKAYRDWLTTNVYDELLDKAISDKTSERKKQIINFLKTHTVDVFYYEDKPGPHRVLVELMNNPSLLPEKGNKTALFGVKIVSLPLMAKERYNDKIIKAMPLTNFKENFEKYKIVSNPFAGHEKEASMFYEWLINGNTFEIETNEDLEEYRQSLLNAILSGELKNLPIYYYAEKNKPTYATILGLLINKPEIILQKWIFDSIDKEFEKFENESVSSVKPTSTMPQGEIVDSTPTPAQNKGNLEHITREYIKQNRNKVFVFGDNDLRKGYGGQAREARGEENAIGIRTKKAPCTGAGCYYTDKEYEENIKKIDEDIQKVKDAIDSGKELVIFPGIGEGLAKLKENAPKTYQYLKQKLEELKNYSTDQVNLNLTKDESKSGEQEEKPKRIKTEREHVKIDRNKILQIRDGKLKSNSNEIIAYRVTENFLKDLEKYNAVGNPFSSLLDENGKPRSAFKGKKTGDRAKFGKAKVYLVETVRDANMAFFEWLTTNKWDDILPELLEYKHALLKKLKSGEWKGKDIIYYKELNTNSHANVLDYLINKYDWSKLPSVELSEEEVEVKKNAEQTKLNKELHSNKKKVLAGFVNHSGGAKGADAIWGSNIKKYGGKNNHYYIKGFKRWKLQNVSISDEKLIKEAHTWVEKASKRLGRPMPTTQSTVALIRRNYFQVKYADGIYAIGKLDRKTNSVEGGTGWAVAMAQEMIDSGSNKALYVFDLNTEKWYVYNGLKFVPTETPTLTKNFAGIGTRELQIKPEFTDEQKAKAKAGVKAIQDVIQKTIREVEGKGVISKTTKIQSKSMALAQYLPTVQFTYSKYLPLIQAMSKSISNVRVKFVSRDEKIPGLNQSLNDRNVNGLTYVNNGYITIYVDEGLGRNAVKTVMHEAIHSYLRSALWPRSSNFNSSFFLSMRDVVYRVYQTMKETGYYDQYKQDLDRIFDIERFKKKTTTDIEAESIMIQEFLAHALSETSNPLADFVTNTKVDNETFKDKIVRLIKRLFEKLRLSPTYLDVIDEIFHVHFGHGIIHSESIANKIETMNFNEEKNKDDYDSRFKEDEETLLNPHTVKTIADILGSDTDDSIAFIQQNFPNVEDLEKALEKNEKWNKSVEIQYADYRAHHSLNPKSLEEFRRHLIVNAWRLAHSMIKHKHVVYKKPNPNTPGRAIVYTENWTNQSNVVMQAYDERTVFDDYIDEYSKLFGVSMEVVRIELPRGFYEYEEDDMIEFVNALRAQGVFFIGLFADKDYNLAIKVTEPTEENIKHVNNVIRDLFRFYAQRAQQANLEIDRENKFWRSNTLMTAMLDLRYGGKILGEGQIGSVMFNPEQSITMNAIKQIKRPVEVTFKTAVPYRKDLHSHLAVASERTGLMVKDGEIVARALIFDSTNIPEDKEIEVEIEGKKFRAKLKDLLLNEQGVETTDGAVFGLEGGFSAVWRDVHAELYSTPIKAVVVNGKGTPALYVKSAFHTVKSRILRKWMNQNNVALILSSSAVKINFNGQETAYKPTEFLGSEKEVDIIEIPFSWIHKKAQKRSAKTNARGLAQSFNANIMVNANRVFKDAGIKDFIEQVTNALIIEFNKYSEHITELDIVMKAIELSVNPTDPHTGKVAALIAGAILGENPILKKEVENLLSETDKKKFKQLQEKIYNEIAEVGMHKSKLIYYPFSTKTYTTTGYIQDFINPIVNAIIFNKIMKVIKLEIPSSWTVISPDLGILEEDNISKAFKFEKRRREKSLESIRKQQQRVEEEYNDLLEHREEMPEDLFKEKEVELLEKIDELDRLETIYEKVDDEVIWKALEKKFYLEREGDTFTGSGRLKDGYILVSEEYEKLYDYGFSEDRAIATVVPSDGITSQSAVRVAGFINTGDENIAKLNSEHFQTKAGKDFDIDTVLLTFPYGNRYFTRKNFVKLWETILKSNKSNDDTVREVFEDVLQDYLTNEQIYDSNVRLKFMQALFGEKEAGAAEWDSLNKGVQTSKLFRKQVGLPIMMRKIVQIISELDIEFNGRKFDPTLPYIALLIYTNDTVDIPTNTNSFFYRFSFPKLIAYGFGYSQSEIDNEDSIIEFAVLTQVLYDLFINGIRTTNSDNLADLITAIKTQKKFNRALDNWIENKQPIDVGLVSPTNAYTVERIRSAINEMDPDFGAELYDEDEVKLMELIRLRKAEVLSRIKFNHSTNKSFVLSLVNNLNTELLPHIALKTFSGELWNYRIDREFYTNGHLYFPEHKDTFNAARTIANDAYAYFKKHDKELQKRLEPYIERVKRLRAKAEVLGAIGQKTEEVRRELEQLWSQIRAIEESYVSKIEQAVFNNTQYGLEQKKNNLMLGLALLSLDKPIEEMIKSKQYSKTFLIRQLILGIIQPHTPYFDKMAFPQQNLKTDTVFGALPIQLATLPLLKRALINGSLIAKSTTDKYLRSKDKNEIVLKSKYKFGKEKLDIDIIFTNTESGIVLTLKQDGKVIYNVSVSEFGARYAAGDSVAHWIIDHLDYYIPDINYFLNKERRSYPSVTPELSQEVDKKGKVIKKGYSVKDALNTNLITRFFDFRSSLKYSERLDLATQVFKESNLPKNKKLLILTSLLGGYTHSVKLPISPYGNTSERIYAPQSNAEIIELALNSDMEEFAIKFATIANKVYHGLSAEQLMKFGLADNRLQSEEVWEEFGEESIQPEIYDEEIVTEQLKKDTGIKDPSDAFNYEPSVKSKLPFTGFIGDTIKMSKVYVDPSVGNALNVFDSVIVIGDKRKILNNYYFTDIGKKAEGLNITLEHAFFYRMHQINVSDKQMRSVTNMIKYTLDSAVNNLLYDELKPQLKDKIKSLLPHRKKEITRQIIETFESNPLNFKVEDYVRNGVRTFYLIVNGEERYNIEEWERVASKLVEEKYEDPVTRKKILLLYKGVIELMKLQALAKGYAETMHRYLDSYVEPRTGIHAKRLKQLKNKYSKLVQELSRGSFFPRFYRPDDLLNIIMKELAEEHPELSKKSLRRMAKEKIESYDIRLSVPEDIFAIIKNSFEGPDNYVKDTFAPMLVFLEKMSSAIKSDLNELYLYEYEDLAFSLEQDPEVIKRMRKHFEMNAANSVYSREIRPINKIKSNKFVAFNILKNGIGYQRRGIAKGYKNGRIYFKIDKVKYERELKEKINTIKHALKDEAILNEGLNKELGKIALDSWLKGYLDNRVYVKSKASITSLLKRMKKALQDELRDKQNWGSYPADNIFVWTRDRNGNWIKVKGVYQTKTNSPLDHASNILLTTLSSLILFGPGAGVKNRTDALYSLISKLGIRLVLGYTMDYGWLGVFTGHKEKAVKVARTILKGSDVELRDLMMLLAKNNESEVEIAGVLKKLTPTEIDADTLRRRIAAFIVDYAIKEGLFKLANISGKEEELIRERAYRGEFNNLPGYLLDKIARSFTLMFSKAEAGNRLIAAGLGAYKAMVIDKKYKYDDIVQTIEKVVAETQGLYAGLYRNIIQSTPKGRFTNLFSQYSQFMLQVEKRDLEARRLLGLSWKYVFKNQDKIEIDGELYDNLPRKIARKYIYDFVLAPFISTLIPPIRVQSPVSAPIAIAMRLLLTALIYGEGPDDDDKSNLLFAILSLFVGLGISFPIEALYDAVFKEKHKDKPVFKDDEGKVWKIFANEFASKSTKFRGFRWSKKAYYFVSDFDMTVPEETYSSKYLPKVKLPKLPFSTEREPNQYQRKVQQFYQFSRGLQLGLGYDPIFPYEYRYGTEKQYELSKKNLATRFIYMFNDFITAVSDVPEMVLVPMKYIGIDKHHK